MNPVQVDAIVEPMLEELGRHLKWKSRGELEFDKDSTWIGSLLENRLAKVPEAHRATVVQRLHSFGHYLEREQRAYGASRTFFIGLESATTAIPVTGSAPRTLPVDGSTSRSRLPADGSTTPPAKKWTFKTKRGASRKSALRPYKRIKTRV
jgi:hypothetical protein